MEHNYFFEIKSPSQKSLDIVKQMAYTCQTASYIGAMQTSRPCC